MRYGNVFAFDDEPIDFDSEGDQLRDEFVARVDSGEQCPSCYYRGGNITRTTVAGLLTFNCPCGCAWHDFVTRPTLAVA